MQQNRPGHQKSKMELAVTMTGKERRQYIEWKADRDRVDIARIERQNLHLENGKENGIKKNLSKYLK